MTCDKVRAKVNSLKDWSMMFIKLFYICVGISVAGIIIGQDKIFWVFFAVQWLLILAAYIPFKLARKTVVNHLMIDGCDE